MSFYRGEKIYEKYKNAPMTRISTPNPIFTIDMFLSWRHLLNILFQMYCFLCWIPIAVKSSENETFFSAFHSFTPCWQKLNYLEHIENTNRTEKLRSHSHLDWNFSSNHVACACRHSHICFYLAKKYPECTKPQKTRKEIKLNAPTYLHECVHPVVFHFEIFFAIKSFNFCFFLFSFCCKQASKHCLELMLILIFCEISFELTSRKWALKSLIFNLALHKHTHTHAYVFKMYTNINKTKFLNFVIKICLMFVSISEDFLIYNIQFIYKTNVEIN